MASKVHHIVLFHPAGKPITQGRVPKIVELQFPDTRPSKNLPELTTEIADDLQPGIRIGPFAFGPKFVLDIIVPGRRHKNIWMTLRLPALVIKLACL